MENVLQEFFSFTTVLEGLKKIERFKGHFYWKEYPKLKRYESVADHSWRVALLVTIVADRLSQKIDLEKALQMALIHDLAEIIAGDASPMGDDGTGQHTYYSNKALAEKKYRKEKQAAEKVFAQLPTPEREKLFDLWMEYEQRECFEAKIVKALDAIECMLQVLEYRKGSMFPKHLTFTTEYGTKYANVDPFLSKLAEYIAEQMKAHYREFTK